MKMSTKKGDDKKRLNLKGKTMTKAQAVQEVLEPLKSINDLFHRAGGSIKVAALVNLNQNTVDRWVRDGRGIPEKYFPLLCEAYGTTHDELSRISEKARRMYGDK